MKKFNFTLIFITIALFYTKAQTFVDFDAGLPDLTFSTCAFADFDGDGDLDLYLSGFDGDNVVGGLYEYDGINFTLLTSSGIPAIYLGSADWGDIDGDGDMDIVVMGTNSSYVDITEIYKNNNNGTFTSLNAGIAPASQGEVTFAHLNDDTSLDLSITGIGTDDRITKLYTNDGTGTFTELASVTLPGMNIGRIKWADYDNDGDNDFVLTGFNDATGGTNNFFSEIYTNNGSESFSISGVSLHKGWLGDVEWADYNKDGFIDLIISGTGGDGTERFTFLYKNNGDGSFTELDPGFPGVSHSNIEWADFDNDGDLDLFIVGEQDTPGNGASISKIFNNDGSDTFSESSVNNLSFSYFGCADSGDFNKDGKVDIVISGYSDAGYAASQSSIYQNKTVVSVSYIDENVLVSPIPAKSFINIKSENIINNITVFNLTGKKVLSQNYNTKSTRINIKNLRTGVYFLKIHTNSENLIRKIIIN